MEEKENKEDKHVCRESGLCERTSLGVPLLQLVVFAPPVNPSSAACSQHNIPVNKRRQSANLRGRGITAATRTGTQGGRKRSFDLRQPRR